MLNPFALFTRRDYFYPKPIYDNLDTIVELYSSSPRIVVRGLVNKTNKMARRRIAIYVDEKVYFYDGNKNRLMTSDEEIAEPKGKERDLVLLARTAWIGRDYICRDTQDTCLSLVGVNQEVDCND